MITKYEFTKLAREVKQYLDSTLDDLKARSPENYLLLLARGEFKEEYTDPTINPYVIDDRMDTYNDEARFRFLSEFMNNYYSFKQSQFSTNDDGYRMSIELMIYTHIWESKPFMKMLTRLAVLSSGADYLWSVTVSDWKKHKYIESEILAPFDATGNQISSIIRNSFHPSLRNAFAHSEYSFETLNNQNKIYLLNYKGKNGELQNISFDDWSKKFAYSVLLSHMMMEAIHFRRLSLVTDFGNNEFEIDHPSRAGIVRKTTIQYREEHNAFNFKK